MNKIEQSLRNFSARSLGTHYSKDELDELIKKQIIIKEVSFIRVTREVDFNLYDLTARNSFSNCTFFKEEKDVLEKEMLEDINEQRDEDFVREHAEDHFCKYSDFDNVTNDYSDVHKWGQSVDKLFNGKGVCYNKFCRAWQLLNEEKSEYVCVNIFAELFDKEQNRMIIKAIKVLMQSEYLSKIDGSVGNTINIDQYISADYFR